MRAFVVPLLAFAGVVGVVALSPRAPGVAPPPPAQATYNEAQIEHLVVGRSMDDVRSALGSPTFSNAAPAGTSWVYEDSMYRPVRVQDAASGAYEPIATVRFDASGTAVAVSF